MCFDVNSNFYFQNNQVLTQTKIKQKLREREREREKYYFWGTKKIQNQNVWTQNRVLKITMIHQYKENCKKKIKNQERERIIRNL